MGEEVEVKVGANVQSAEDAFRSLGAEAQKSLEGIGSEGEKVSGRLAAMDKLWDSPARLGKAAALAKLDLDALNASVEKAGGMTPALAQSFEAAGTKIDAASDRARQFADVAGDLRTKGDEAAKGMETAAGAAGSLEGMLGRLKDTGSAAQGKLADLAFGAIGLVQAFKLGYSTGEDLSKMLEGLGVDMKGFQKFNEDSIVASMKLAGVLKDSIPIYQQMSDAARTAGEAHMEMQRKATAAINALTDAGKLKDWRKEVQSLSDDIDNYSLALQKAAKGGPQELANVITFSRDKFVALGKSVKDVGMEYTDLDPILARAIRSAEAMAKAGDEAKKSADEWADAQKKLRDALDIKMPDFNAFNETGKILGQIRDVEKALNDAKRALAPDDYKRYVSEIEGELRRWSAILTKHGKEIPKVMKEALDEIDTKERLAEQGRAWDEYARIQASAVTDSLRPLDQLAEAYKELDAARSAAVKSGDTDASAELQQRMNANYVAQAAAMERIAQAARDANIALGAFNTITTENAGAVEQMIAQTKAWDAAQRDLNEAFRNGEVRLNGVAWAIRHATEKTTELSEAQKALIEELAKISDANPQSQLWFGHMVATLEEDMKKGKGSLEQFKLAVQELFRGLQQLAGEVPSMIDLTGLFTQLTEIMRLLEGQKRG